MSFQTCDEPKTCQKSSAKANLSTVQAPIFQKLFICYSCEKNFCSKFSLKRHLTKCEKSVTNKERHRPTKKTKGNGNALCPLCNNYRDAYQEMIRHYSDQHDIQLTEQYLKFDNLEEFEKWKLEMEKRTLSKYIRRSMKEMKSSKIYYYRCHRDGFYRKRGKNLRHLKSTGSNKINGHCPSKLDVTTTRLSSVVTVKYVDTHVGHKLEVYKLPIEKSDKDILAAKLSQKVSFDKIINDIKSGTDDVQSVRLQLLKRKDLYNIERQYKISNSVRHSSGCQSIDLWVNEMTENNCNSVIRYYKPAEQYCDQYPVLRREDFLLVIMNETQLEMLKKFGSFHIYVDTIDPRGRKRLNGHFIKLTSLITVDDSKQPILCLLAFSNRSDYAVLKIVFSILKNCLNFTLSPSSFMSDMSSGPYKAWSEVMGPINKRFICSWDILKAWKKIIDIKVKDFKKQTVTYTSLKKLLNASNDTTFESMIDSFMNSAKEDADLMSFIKYFQKVFYSTRKLWANCYRSVDTLLMNQNLEEMHLILNRIYFDEKISNQVDRIICSIMKVIRGKLFEGHLICQEGEYFSKTAELKKKHRHSESEFDQMQIIEEPIGVWNITLSSGNEKFIVEKSKSDLYCDFKCPDCDTCVHAYICSCYESCIKWDMCKHVHFLENVPPSSTEIDFQKEMIDSQDTSEGDDNFESVCLPSIADECEIPTVLTTEADSLCTAIEDLTSDRTMLVERCQQIIDAATTKAKCKVIDNSLTLILQTLNAMDSVNNKVPTAEFYGNN